MDQSNCPDCRLLYRTEEGTVTIDAHMFILTKSAYLDALFRWQESVPVNIGKKYINQYNVDIPFDYFLFEFCIKFLYDKKEIKKIIDMDIEWYPYIFAIIDFLQLDNKYYSFIIGVFLTFIDKVTDSSKCLHIIQTVCNSNISTFGKQSFVARTLYLLTEEHKNCIDKQYIQEYIYHGKSYVTDDGSIIVNNLNSLIHNNIPYLLKIVNKKNEIDCKMFVFNSTNVDVIVRLFDRDDFFVSTTLSNRKKNKLNNNGYGVVGKITKHCVCEIIITPKKTENLN